MGPWDAEAVEWDDENDDGNIAELAAHHIAPREVHEVLDNRPTWVPNRRRRAGDWKLLGTTYGGRRLTIIVRYYEDRRLLRPITGWDPSPGEQSRYFRRNW
jgi:hypothetical protein